MPRADPSAGDALLEGLLLRAGAVTGDTLGAEAVAGDTPVAGSVKAFCLLCPHEICNVEYRRDTASVRLDSGAAPRHPLLVCPCHFSVFDPLSDGVVLSGPAPRGLYRFAVRVERDTVEIERVEEEVLTLLGSVSRSREER